MFQQNVSIKIKIVSFGSLSIKWLIVISSQRKIEKMAAKGGSKTIRKISGISTQKYVSVDLKQLSG